MVTHRAILSIDDLTDSDVSRIFFAARGSLSESRKARLRGRVLMTVFFESSTRTRLSFEMAAHRLSMGISTFQVASSSMSKGEAEAETLENLFAMSPDVVVIRQASTIDRSRYAQTNCALINGGDGVNEHPSQALLDCFTLTQYFRTDSLAGKNILLIGDVAHSRVAHSNLKLMTRLGARVTFLAPDVFQEPGALLQQRTVSSFDELDDQFDAVMCLRVQKERIQDGKSISDLEFAERYSLTEERLERLGHCVILHPGPMNIGIEITKATAYHPRSLILEQVKNGVLVRAAMIEHCLF